MTSNEYQNSAMRTCNIPYEDKKSMIIHGIMCLTSEAGEVAGIYQKTYQGHPFDKVHMKLELGDVCWAIAEICTALGFTFEEVMTANVKKLQERYPEGFSAEKSLHRKEGDI